MKKGRPLSAKSGASSTKASLKPESFKKEIQDLTALFIEAVVPLTWAALSAILTKEFSSMKGAGGRVPPLRRALARTAVARATPPRRRPCKQDIKEDESAPLPGRTQTHGLPRKPWLSEWDPWLDHELW